MQPDADFYRVGRMPEVVVVERALDADGAFNGLARRVEGHHEAVAGRLDLLTGVLRDLLAHDLVMRIHDRLGSGLALVLAQAGGADDVGEQHGHGRRLGHPLSPARRRPFGRCAMSSGPEMRPRWGAISPLMMIRQALNCASVRASSRPFGRL